MTPTTRRRVLVVAQLLIVGVVLWYAAARLAGQWTEFRTEAGSLEPAWWLIAISAAVVLATYALLVESWRRLVRAAGGRL